jgi:hypothetical protein
MRDDFRFVFEEFYLPRSRKIMECYCFNAKAGYLPVQFVFEITALNTYN